MPLFNLLFSMVVGTFLFFVTGSLGLPIQEATMVGCTSALLVVIAGNQK